MPRPSMDAGLSATAARTGLGPYNDGGRLPLSGHGCQAGLTGNDPTGRAAGGPTRLGPLDPGSVRAAGPARQGTELGGR